MKNTEHYFDGTIIDKYSGRLMKLIRDRTTHGKGRFQRYLS
ncbi:MAG TPA: hypothetical protein VI278_02035 [Nitrososphaeraceae archaeon]